MQNLTATFFRRTVVLAFSFALTSVLAASAQAQIRMTEEQKARQAIEQDREDREWALRNLGKGKKVDLEVGTIQVSLAKVKEDYVGIQEANNDLLTMLAGGKGLDYKLIADSSGEIRKRAGHLKSYIVVLQLAAQDKKRAKNLDEIPPEEMKASLLSLDAKIVHVISSPIFKNFGSVVDKESSAKALNELDNIIELSERIKRTAESNIKNTRASR